MGIAALLLGFLCSLLLARLAWVWALGFVVFFDLFVPWFTGQLSLDVLFDTAPSVEAARITVGQLSNAIITSLWAVVGLAIGYLAKRFGRSRSPARTDGTAQPVRPRSLWPYVSAAIALVLLVILAAIAIPTFRTEHFDSVEVLFGTNRKEESMQPLVYGGERTKHLAVGSAVITIPKLHARGRIERPKEITFLGVRVFKETEDAKRHFIIRHLDRLTLEEFSTRASSQLARAQSFKDQAFVYVHGYNISFDHALFRTAQLAYDLEFDGATFLFSWPSGASLGSYTYDKDSAKQAEPFLIEFLDRVVSTTSAKQVHLIAHSMGTSPLLDALEKIQLKWPTEKQISISTVILAAPDVDHDVFEGIAGRLDGWRGGLTLYASASDKAMAASRMVAGGRLRAGDVSQNGPIIVKGVDSIDVSAANTEFLNFGHSAYAERSIVLDDIKILLRTGMRPPHRRLPDHIAPVESPNGTFWRLTCNPCSSRASIIEK